MQRAVDVSGAVSFLSTGELDESKVVDTVISYAGLAMYRNKQVSDLPKVFLMMLI